MKSKSIPFRIGTQVLQAFGFAQAAEDSGNALDSTLVKPSGVSGEYMVYQAKEKSLPSFLLDLRLLHRPVINTIHPTISISGDGETYKEITPDIHESGGQQRRVRVEGFPAGTRNI